MGWNCPQCKSELILAPVEADSPQMELVFSPHNEERTQTLYTVWRNGKYYDNLKHTVNYPDCTLISMSETTYTVLVGNQEIQFDTLDEAERWLWNNWVASEKEAGQV